MQNEEKYILVNLEDEKSKELATIISNSTSRKILNYLSTKDEVSESDISKELKLPLSTVHYNLKQLKKNSLVETKHFVYSEKGKKIELYRVVKKFIVIAPKYTRKNLIQNILPLFLISAAISLIIQFVNNLGNKTTSLSQKAFSDEAAQLAMPVAEVVTKTYYGYWFLIGAWSILVIYLIINLIKKRS